jgi:hypothetical protein
MSQEREIFPFAGLLGYSAGASPVGPQHIAVQNGRVILYLRTTG